MIVAIISSSFVAIFLVSRHYIRRQFLSSSFHNHMTPISIPIHQQLHETTHIIKNSFFWFEVNMSHQQDQSPLTTSSSSSSAEAALIHPASLTFSVRWDEKIKSLFIRVLNARDLYLHKHHQPPLIIDSYIRLHSSKDAFPSMRTHIIKQNPHPIYDELFEYPDLQAITDDDDHSIIFTASTYDTFTRDEIIGEITFPMKLNTLDSTEMTFTENFIPRHRQFDNQELGQMLLSVCYQPPDSSLTIIVLKASNLPRLGPTRLINPYFKIYMFYKQQRIAKKRSTIKRTTQTAVYNECFIFSIPENDIANIHFDVILFDYDRHMKHQPIGRFSMGKELDQHWNDVCHRQVTKQIAHWYQLKPFTLRFLRHGQRQPSILDEYANLYRPEVESEMEYLAVQTSRNKSLQINYEIEQQGKRQRAIRYHILRRKYVAHPNDIQVDPYVKNHLQFLHKNYPQRWTVSMLADSFNQSIENVRLILRQRTKRAMRVRPRSPSTLFGINDENEREKLVREHMIKRDLRNTNQSKDDDEPVDHQVLAEESDLIPRQRPSKTYTERDNDGFFSNVISSSDEDQQTERDISLKKKLLTSSSSTLLDRINKLRLHNISTSNTSMDNPTSDLHHQRLEILHRMQQTNDSLVEMNERKQKYLPKSPRR